MNLPICVCICNAITWLAFSESVSASSEGGVAARIESVVIDASEAGYRFSVKTDENNALDLVEVGWADKKLSFNKKDFGEVEQVFIQGVKIIAPIEKSMGRQDAVIIVLPYNKHRVESENDEATGYQFDVVRLHFYKGQLSMWEKAEAIEGQADKWKLTSKGDIISDVVNGVDKVDKDGVYDNGEASGVENPYARIKIYEDSH